jgi:hypothetical protein
MSAATLLLLVTMVLSTTPAVPAASMVRVGDDRSAPVGVHVEESVRGERSLRVRHRVQRNKPTVSAASCLIRPAERHASIPSEVAHRDGSIEARHAHVRVELIALPPPVQG